MKRHLWQLAKLLVYGAISLFLLIGVGRTFLETLFFAIVLYVLFFFVFFKKEMGTNPREWFEDSPKSSRTISKDKLMIYENAGLSPEDITFFREKMRVAKDQITQAEHAVSHSSKLVAITQRHNTIALMKDFFKEIVQQPQRLYEVDKFLNTYLPSMVELTEKYDEISHHAAKIGQTYEALHAIADAIEELCVEIEHAYVTFQAKDFEVADVEMKHMRTQAQHVDEFQDF